MGLPIAPLFHYMGREVEHKYRVKNDHWRREAGRGIEYGQGDLCLDPQRSVRVRLSGDKSLLTMKGQSEGSARDEFEFSVPVGSRRSPGTNLSARGHLNGIPIEKR